MGQGPGDLGARLARALDRGLSRGARTATVMGSDHPDLPAPLLRACLALAGPGRAGWIPTEDGGFAALTIAPGTDPSALFRGVPWSTPDAASAVRENASRAGVVLEAAGTWYDVDTPADLRRLARALRESGACPATRRVLDALMPPLDRRPEGSG